MTIAANSLIEISTNMLCLGQRVFNVFQYQVTAMVDPVSALNIGVGWWNDVKAVYRAFPTVAAGPSFISVLVRELNNPTGDYAEYAIPTGEQGGTRAVPAQNEPLPPFLAGGIRMTVGTRVTRPGQKRIPFMVESDQNSGSLQASFLTPLAAFAGNIATVKVLGIPALLVELTPIVCRKDNHGVVTAHQPVTGAIINPNVTSQNSRKIGRGI